MTRTERRAAADERRAYVLERREQGVTLKEIANEMGVSEARVWQIKTKGLQILNISEVRVTQYKAR
jgi:DNA-directed RNA polymerase specialized sigma subunit